MKITHIIKRSGEMKSYDIDKIIRAAHKGLSSVGNKKIEDAQKIAQKVDEFLQQECEKSGECTPSVEHIQDIVEQKLME